MSGRALPPGPGARNMFRNLRALRANVPYFLQDVARRYGDIAYMRFGRQRVVLLNHPDFIRDVLVTHNKKFAKGRGMNFIKKVIGNGLLASEGELHLRQRRLMQPLFQKKRIAAFAALMGSSADGFNVRLYNRKPVDMANEMMKLTLTIAGRALFSLDIREECEQIGRSLDTAMRLFPRLMMPAGSLLFRMPLPQTRAFNRAVAHLDAVIREMIAERRRVLPEGPDDLLTLLLNARDEQGEKGMSDRQVRDELITLLLAGHETTAIALTWTWFLLATHPHVEERMHAEIVRVLQGRIPTAEDLAELPYTRSVFLESMRLYPPAYVIARRALQEHEVAGYRIPRDATVLMSQFLMHRDARFFREPDFFLPERWASAEIKKLPRFAYFPFGGGPRVCIGEAFALQEGLIILATLAQRWRFRLAGDQPVDILPQITLRPRYGMRMIPELRVHKGSAVMV